MEGSSKQERTERCAKLMGITVKEYEQLDDNIYVKDSRPHAGSRAERYKSTEASRPARESYKVTRIMREFYTPTGLVSYHLKAELPGLASKISGILDEPGDGNFVDYGGKWQKLRALEKVLLADNAQYMKIASVNLADAITSRSLWKLSGPSADDKEQLKKTLWELVNDIKENGNHSSSERIWSDDTPDWCLIPGIHRLKSKDDHGTPLSVEIDWTLPKLTVKETLGFPNFTLKSTGVKDLPEDVPANFTSVQSFEAIFSEEVTSKDIDLLVGASLYSDALTYLLATSGRHDKDQSDSDSKWLVKQADLGLKLHAMDMNDRLAYWMTHDPKQNWEGDTLTIIFHSPESSGPAAIRFHWKDISTQESLRRSLIEIGGKKFLPA